MAGEAADLVADRYRLLDRLGGGAMGVVWLGHDTLLDRDVAVKELLINAGMRPEQVREASQRAMREARIAARMHHPHAISIYDVVEHDGKPCLIMEFLPSRTLAELIAEQGPLPPERVGRIGAQIAGGLAAAHAAGIVHRDVKPGNVLLAEDGTAKLTDFGISRASGDSTVTATGLLAGTPAYLAPEVAQGEPATRTSDLYSLGATLYCALEGTPPFGEDANPIALLYRIANNPAPPPLHAGPLTDIVSRLLRSDPQQRPDATETEEILLGIAADAPEPPPPPPPPAVRATRPRRRRALVAGLVLAVLVTTGTLVAIALTSDPGTVKSAPPVTTRSAPPATATTTIKTTTTPPSATTTPPPASTSTPATTTPSDVSGQLSDAITGYYQLMPGNLNSAWNHMTADYQQNHAGGMAGYQRFWQPIATVAVSDVVPSPPDSVTATITYHYRDGHVVVERTQFQLTQQDGMWKIAGSSVLSHSGTT
jgi:serine/threonine protein kinase